MKQIITLVLAVCALTLTACQKKATVATNTRPVITIAQPVDKQTYRSGDSVTITGQVTYNGELHGCEVTITDTATGFILFDQAQHVHADKFEVAAKWGASATKLTTVKLSVIAFIDHNGNQETRTVFFNIQP